MCRFSWSNEGDGSKVGFGKSPLPPLLHPHLSPQPITSPHLSLTWPGLEQLWCRLRRIGCEQRAQTSQNVEQSPDFNQRSQKVGHSANSHERQKVKVTQKPKKETDWWDLSHHYNFEWRNIMDALTFSTAENGSLDVLQSVRSAQPPLFVPKQDENTKHKPMQTTFQRHHKQQEIQKVEKKRLSKKEKEGGKHRFHHENQSVSKKTKEKVKWVTGEESDHREKTTEHPSRGAHFSFSWDKLLQLHQNGKDSEVEHSGSKMKVPHETTTESPRSKEVGSPYFSVNWGRLQELLDQSSTKHEPPRDQSTKYKAPRVHLEARPKVPGVQSRGDMESGSKTTNMPVVLKQDENPAKRQTTINRRAKEVGSPYFSVNWERLKELLEEDRNDESQEMHLEGRPKVSGVRSRGETRNALFEESSKDEPPRRHLEVEGRPNILQRRGDVKSITPPVVSEHNKKPSKRKTQKERIKQVGSPYFSVDWGRLQELIEQSKEERLAMNHIEANPKPNEDDKKEKKRKLEEGNMTGTE